MRHDAGHDGDHERGLREALPLGGDLLRVGVGIVGLEGGREHLAEAAARLALDQDEAPGHQLAVVRHPGGDRQEGLDLRLARPGLAQPARRDGAALQEAGKAIIHGIFIRLE